MKNKTSGLHHITAIAGEPQWNYDFYTGVLGLRMVKKTVNFDDPNTYHLYYADEVGTPGTVLTFFPWPGVKPGKNGAGMATKIGYSVPKDSLDFWQARFEQKDIPHELSRERFGEKRLTFQDPDGLWLTLYETSHIDARKGWQTLEISSENAIKGFHSVTLTLSSIQQTTDILTSIFGYRPVDQDGNTYRFQSDAVNHAAIVDLVEDPGADRGINAGGTIHHVAFRVKDEEAQMELSKKIRAKGLYITEKINRNYFYSVYFREPGGILFEIATENPGFLIDESVENLGNTLQLPDQYEPYRKRIEKRLPELKVSKNIYAP